MLLKCQLRISISIVYRRFQGSEVEKSGYHELSLRNVAAASKHLYVLVRPASPLRKGVFTGVFIFHTCELSAFLWIM
jgi:hypothetical protein